MLILVAEDNADNRDMLARRLTRRGFEVMLAEDGEAALDQVRARRPDIVLMDVSMPVMSGLDATRALRADPATRELKIIALTAHAMASAREECLGAGCDAFATKPVDFQALVSLIETMHPAA